MGTPLCVADAPACSHRAHLGRHGTSVKVGPRVRRKIHQGKGQESRPAEDQGLEKTPPVSRYFRRLAAIFQVESGLNQYLVAGLYSTLHVMTLQSHALQILIQIRV